MQRVEDLVRELDIPSADDTEQTADVRPIQERGSRVRLTSKQDQQLETQVEDLRNEMDGLRGQLQEMQGLLRKIAEREQLQIIVPPQN